MVAQDRGLRLGAARGKTLTQQRLSATPGRRLHPAAKVRNRAGSGRPTGRPWPTNSTSACLGPRSGRARSGRAPAGKATVRVAPSTSGRDAGAEIEASEGPRLGRPGPPARHPAGPGRSIGAAHGGGDRRAATPGTKRSAQGHVIRQVLAWWSGRGGAGGRRRTRQAGAGAAAPRRAPPPHAMAANAICEGLRQLLGLRRRHLRQTCDRGTLPFILAARSADAPSPSTRAIRGAASFGFTDSKTLTIRATSAASCSSPKLQQPLDVRLEPASRVFTSASSLASAAARRANWALELQLRRLVQPDPGARRGSW
jgi:hypothetical protein